MKTWENKTGTPVKLGSISYLHTHMFLIGLQTLQIVLILQPWHISFIFNNVQGITHSNALQRFQIPLGRFSITLAIIIIIDKRYFPSKKKKKKHKILNKEAPREGGIEKEREQKKVRYPI